MSAIDNGLGFMIHTNVDIKVIDTERNELIKSVRKHNKAKRGLVKGLLRFMQGQFNPSFRQRNIDAIYNLNDASNYIPCFIGVGDGGIVKDSDGKPTYQIPRIPIMEKTWNDVVDYQTETLIHEIDTGSRCEIGKITDSTAEPSSGDIDSIYIEASLPPGFCNVYDIGDSKITSASISEVGLFASPVCGAKDILASVQLTNRYDEEGIIKGTDILYVRPQDTVLITWTISFIALSSDSILNGNDVDSDIGFLSVGE